MAELPIPIPIPLPEWVVEFIALNWETLLKIIIIPGLAFILLFELVAVWFERKFLADAMLRIGPLYCGRVAGWLQLIADALKLTVKELFAPKGAHKVLFYAVPVFAPTIPALAVVLIPFGPDWILFRAGGAGLLLFFALTSLIPVLTILAGWASNNKYTIIGALRSAYLYIAAEMPLFIAAAGVVILAGTFDLVEIVELQSKMWFAIPQFIGFITFFIAMLGASERVPFDIPVAEQELVLGWRTEYTGIAFGLLMTVEYACLLAWSLLFITLYLGGYQGPPILGPGTASGIFWMLVKLGIVVAIAIFLRVVFPRYRIDQALRLGWRYLIPLALLNIFLTLAMKPYMLALLK